MIGNKYSRTEGGETRRGHRKPDRFIGLRNILNLIFMLGALCGVLVYFMFDSQIGTIVILSSMVFKFVECVFRFIK